jgi:hypothetical protein
MAEFAIFIPVGPTEDEVQRTADLLDSLFTYEPQVSAVIFVDDVLEPRDLATKFKSPSSCKVVSILNPRRGLGQGHLGGGCVASLAAYGYINAHLKVDFTLKCDTDALIIGPFSIQLLDALKSNPGAGIVGSFGQSCNPDSRYYRYFADANRQLSHALEVVPDFESLSEHDKLSGRVCITDKMTLTLEQIIAFGVIRKHIERALSQGYELGEYVQGGSYALSGELIRRLGLAGYLDQPLLWRDIPSGEDVMMGIYTRSVGMSFLSMTGVGEPFAIQYRGLPYPPEVLVKRGHAMTHSVKNDPACSEEKIRAYFKEQRLRVLARHTPDVHCSSGR